MDTEILGVWSVEALFQMGSQSDEILVFKADGTGWIERINYQEWSADFFEWAQTSHGWLSFEITRRIETHPYTRQLVEVLPSHQTDHTSAKIEVKRAPSGKEMRVLRIQIFEEGGHEMYGLVSDDPQTRPEPTGQII